MPGLKSRYLLPALLILATVLVDAVWITRYGRDLDLIETVLVGVIFGQIAALGHWLVLGRMPVLLRLVIVLGGAGLLSVGISLPEMESVADMMSIVVFYSSLFAAPAAVMRLAGFSFARPDSGEPSSSTWNGGRPAFWSKLSVLRPWQFSLGTLFAWTTCAALLMGLFQWIGLPWPEFVDWTDSHDLLMIFTFFGGFAASAGVVYWSVLRGKRPLLRTTIAFLVAVPSSVGAGLFGNFWDIPDALALGLAFTSYCLAVAAMLRIAGFRLERRRSGDGDPDLELRQSSNPQSPVEGDADRAGEDECRN